MATDELDPTVIQFINDVRDVEASLRRAGRLVAQLEKRRGKGELDVRQLRRLRSRRALVAEKISGLITPIAQILDTLESPLFKSVASAEHVGKVLREVMMQLFPSVPISPDDFDDPVTMAQLKQNIRLARLLLDARMPAAFGKLVLDIAKFDPPPNLLTEGIGYLNLLVDDKARTIRRIGHDAVVNLQSKPTLWSTFCIFYAAGDADAPEAAWRNALQGEWDAHRETCKRLREVLAALGIRIPNRGRRLIDDRS